MKIPTIRLRKTLEVTMNDTSERLMELDGLDKKALRDEYKEWIESIDNNKDQPHVRYANQINIEQL